MLVFATVAALRLSGEWGMSYSEIIPYATPGFVAFGLAAVPAGWLADKWSREGMMSVFFFGIGVASLLCALAQTPMQIAGALFLLGIFAAIYHPVGLAMVVQDRSKTGFALALNGVFGNMGVACAALITGWLIDHSGWRAAFVVPGLFTIALGVGYVLFLRACANNPDTATAENAASRAKVTIPQGALFARILAVVLFTTALGGLVFQSTTFALPKVFDERLTDLGTSATQIGGYAFIVFALAAFAQLVVGYLLDRYSLRTIFAVVAGLQAVFFFVMVKLTGSAALAVAIAFMLAVFGQIPINDVLVGRISRSEWRSRMFAIRYIVTFSVAASSIPLIAWLHAHWGFDTIFLLLAIVAAAIFLAVLTLPKAGGSILGQASTAS